MKVLVLDTNIYGWFLARAIDGVNKKEAINSFKLIQKLIEDKDTGKPRVQVYTCDLINKEIRRAKNPDLERLHDSLVSG